MADDKLPVVAFLTENYRENETNEYQNLMLAGLHRAAVEEGVSLVHVSYLHNRIPGQPNAQLDFVLDILAGAKVDGILFQGFIHAASAQLIARLQAATGQVPLLSLGRQIAGLPAVIFDGTALFLELLDHLYQVHGCRRIAFVPPYNPDSRIDLYRSFMEGHGLSDPGLLLPDRVLRDVLGRERYGDELAFDVLHVLQEAAPDFDAIICTTSRETVSIQEALVAAGRQPGVDVALVCCEDGLRNRSATPPLSATQYPWDGLGYEGLRTMAARLRGEPCPEVVTVGSRNVWRRSCGCESWIVDLVRQSRRAGTDCLALLEASFAGSGFDCRALGLAARQAVELGDDSRFMEPFGQVMAGLQDEHALFMLEHFLMVSRNCLLAHLGERAVQAGHPPDPPGAQADSPSASPVDFQGRLDVLLVKARSALRERMENLMERHLLESRIALVRIQRLGQDLVTTFDPRQLRVVLAQRLVSLAVQTCHLMVHRPPAGGTPGDGTGGVDAMELFFSSRSSPGGTLGWGSRPGLAVALRQVMLPPRDRATLILLPLALEGEILGLVAFEAGPLDGNLYGAMAVQLATAYKSVSLVERLSASQREVEALNHHLEDRIRERTVELTAANRELNQAIGDLTSTRDKLVHSEKMAALARLMGAVAHELNTPLGVIISAASYLDAITARLEDQFQDNRLSRSELAGFFAKKQEALRLIQQNISKANAHISQFKALSLEPRSPAIRTLELKPFLEATLFDIRSRHPELTMVYSLGCPAGLSWAILPEALVQVLENLVHWSIVRSRPGNLELDLQVRPDGAMLRLTYHDPVCLTGWADTAVAVAAGDSSAGYVQRMADGTLGLELGIVWSTVTQVLGGQVVLDQAGAGGVGLGILLPDATRQGCQD